jgi:hypothetical protein
MNCKSYFRLFTLPCLKKKTVETWNIEQARCTNNFLPLNRYMNIIQCMKRKSLYLFSYKEKNNNLKKKTFLQNTFKTSYISFFFLIFGVRTTKRKWILIDYLICFAFQCWTWKMRKNFSSGDTNGLFSFIYFFKKKMQDVTFEPKGTTWVKDV